ncbi:hypothetical protein CHS0354_001244 [Potamilus streckersoni]|uniref:RNA helicase n=1 Tax=Potamilus streckersoni TaxID=2493646 RepID=A0AAE0S3S9_9BIVA|nr:hypothetical protein CHS0354_001244 [Potamilus streckersoni]
MDHKRSKTQTDIAGSEVSGQAVGTNLRFGTSSAERRPAFHNLGKKSQSEPGELYPTGLVTFHRNGSKPDLYSKEDGEVTNERIKKTAGKPEKMTHSVQADEDASDHLGGNGLGRSGSPSDESNSSDLQMKQIHAGTRLTSSAESRNECSEQSKCFAGKSSEDDVHEEKHSVSALRARFQGQNEITSVPKVEFCCAIAQESTSKEEKRRNKETQPKNEHFDVTGLNVRMDSIYFEDQANFAGFEDLSEDKRQTVKSNLRFGSSPGERRPDLPHLGNKSQSETVEDFPTRSVTFNRNGRKTDLSSKGDGNETKEGARKTPDKSRKMTHSVQADGDASGPLGGRYFGRSEFPSKVKYSSDLQLNQTFARLMSSAKSRNECSEQSKYFAGKSSEDDVHEEKHSVSALRARFQGQNEITSVSKIDFLNDNMKESKSKRELFERCWSEKENGSRDIWEPEDKNPFLEPKSEQERRNKGTKDKNEHLDGTDVSGKMDSMHFGELADMAGSVVTSEVTRQTVQGNLKFDPSSALVNLGNKFQSEPGEEYPVQSMIFYRNKPSFKASEGDGSETEERVKKIAGGSKKMTHSLQADGEASYSLGGRDVEKSDFPSKFNSLSASVLQSEEIFSETRPRYWRGKENGSKYRMETGDRVVLPQRSKPEHEIPCHENQSEQEKMRKDRKHKKLSEKPMRFPNPKDEEKFKKLINEKHGSLEQLPLLKGSEPLSSKENFQFVDCINRQEVKENKETFDTDKKVKGVKGRINKDVSTAKGFKGWENKDVSTAKGFKGWENKDVSTAKGFKGWENKDVSTAKGFKGWENKDVSSAKGLKGRENKDVSTAKGFKGWENKDVSAAKGLKGTENKDVSSAKGLKGRINKDVSTAKGFKGWENKDVSAAKGLKGTENKDVSSAKGLKGTENKDVQRVKGLEGRENKDVSTVKRMEDRENNDVLTVKEIKGRENKGVPVKEMKGRENKDVPTSNGKTRNKQNYKMMKQKDEMNPKLMKIQRSILCVNFSSEAETGSDLRDYLKYRLGDRFKYKFEVQNSETITLNGQKNIKVTLSFPSKVVAKKAKECLQQSNRKSATKLLIYFPEEKVRELIVLDPYETESRFERHLKIIVERAKETLALHKSKINEKIERVMKLEERLEGRKLSLREFENTKSEIKATKEKCKELELQKKEFCSYIQCVHDKLEVIKNSMKFETKMNEIRIAFGIECRRLSEALPIYARRSDILSEVKNSQVSVILGETGSGKSTQMTQYLYQAGFAEHGLIACTQPRKIAAVTLATFVASEMASSVGQIVGYHVGMKVKRSKITKILYMTDHILLNECLQDNELKNFSCIIIDEAHERSIFTDLLLGMIKSALKKRPDLKVIITSATINPDVFVSYFGGPEKCPVVRVSGRAYPVELVWLNQVDDQNPFDDYVTKAINTAVNLHWQNPPADGDILVFLTTPLETEKCCEEFVQKCPKDDSFQCLPLHGKLQPDEQQKVFQLNRPNKRKVVFATNSAETSITIPGVKFVVDTGLAKEMRFDPKRNISSLSVYPISQSSAEQRKGRAGRTSPGKCYRLYNEKTYETMEKNTKPEIFKVHLGQALLKLLELGVDPLSFDFVESPSREALENAMQSLCDIGAVEDNKISKLGWWVSKLPIEPRQGILLKKGILAGIPMEALVVASFSGGGRTFYRSGTEEEKKKADIKKIEFCHKEGDILTLLNVYRRLDKVAEKQKGAWCFQNCINAKSLRGVRETMNELRTILKRDLREDILFEFRSVEGADSILKKVLIETLKQNVCCFLGHEKAGYFNLVNHHHVQIHPSSVLKPLDLHPELIVYEQVLKTSADFVTNITPINEEEMILLPSELLDIYKSTKDKICVSLKQTYWTGQKVLKQFIGPLHQNRREIEGRLSTVCENRTVVLDANKITGKIQLYCCKVDEQLTVRMLEDVLDKITKPLLQKCVEVPVGKTDGGVRVVLGAGAEIINILMPYQYRTLIVKQKLQSAKEIEVSDVEEVFSLYGEITDIKPFMKKDGKDPSYWGTVTFMRDIDATNAVTSLTSSANRFFEAIPQLPRTNSNTSRDFKVKLTWWRRRGKGIAYVKMAWPEDFVIAMAERSVTIDGHVVSIQQSRENGTHDTTNQLYLRGLRYDILEEDIKAAFKRLLGISEAQVSNRIKHIVIPREASETSKRMYIALCEKIEMEVSQYAPRGSFDIAFVPDPVKKQTCIRYTVLVSFSNPNEGQTALNSMRINPPSFGVYPVHVTAELETSVTIWKKVYEAVRSEIEPTIEFIMSQNPNVSVKTNLSRAGNVFLNIKSNDASLLGHAKVLLHDVVQGDILECGRNKEIARLFTRDGRCEMKRIEKETGAVIFVDNRTMSVSIQGIQTSRTKALSDINEYLSTLAGLIERHLQLKGDGKPRGVMKELISKYGTDLEQMKEHTGVKSLKLNLRNHQITVLGDQDCWQNG